MFVGGSFFMLRELEISLATISHISVSWPRKVVTWLLPVSKNDPKALGCHREWGCVCENQENTACPFCSITGQMRELRRRSGDDPDGNIIPTLPLFPTSSGGVPTKAAVADTIVELAKRLNISGKANIPLCLATPHTCRISGARAMARLGFELFKIQLMGRWSSAIVMLYVQDAPLQGLTAEYRDRLAAHALEEVVRGLHNEVKEIKDLRAGLDSHMRAFIADEIECRDAAASASADSCTDLVMSDYGVTHVPPMRAARAMGSPWRHAGLCQL